MRSTPFMPWGWLSRGLNLCFLLLLPSPTQAATSSWVRTVAQITDVSRVLVDQPTGTTIAMDTGGPLYVLRGATAAPPAWFAPGLGGAPNGAMYALGDGQGHVPVGTFPDAVAIDSSLHRAFIANGVDGTVTVLDTRSGLVSAVVPVGGAPSSVAVDRRDGLVYVATGRLVYFPESYQNTQTPPPIPC